MPGGGEQQDSVLLRPPPIQQPGEEQQLNINLVQKLGGSGKLTSWRINTEDKTQRETNLMINKILTLLIINVKQYSTRSCSFSKMIKYEI